MDKTRAILSIRCKKYTFKEEFLIPTILTVIIREEYTGGVGMSGNLSKSEKTASMEPEMVIFKYMVLSFLSEASKLLILALLFQRKMGIFIFSVLVMFLLRTTTGGMHCKRYWSCFLVSFSYLLLCIEVLPMIALPKSAMMIILLICLAVTYYIGPVISQTRPQPTSQKRHRLKMQAFMVIFCYMIVLYILPESSYMISGFWIVVLHAIQLSFAELKAKGGLKNEFIKFAYAQRHL